MECRILRQQRKNPPMAIGNADDLHERLSRREDAVRLLGWILSLGKLKEYRLAMELAKEHWAQLLRKGVEPESGGERAAGDANERSESDTTQRTKRRRRKKRHKF